jgi:ABC-2 type transport system ATP-binding protein
MPPVVVAEALSKTYITTKRQPGVIGALKTLVRPEKVEVEAVKSISFSIEQGELVGFLGPNGAGKTTTLKMLTGILHPTGGSGSVLGFDPTKRRPEMQRQMSLVMGNKMQLWWDLPAWESFTVLRDIYDVPQAEFQSRIDELIDLLDLREKIKTQVRKLSLGERMKCELAAALLHNPKVLFLDEPTLGLDIISQKRIREFLKRHNENYKTTILLTSHYMQDVEELCERVIIIDQGSLKYDGSLNELSRRFSSTRRLHFVFSEPVSADLSEFGKVVSQSEGEADIEVPRERTSTVAARALNSLPVEDFSISEPAIEDVIREMFTQPSDESARA